MIKICEMLAQSRLFEGLSAEVFGEFCSKVNVRVLWKGEILVNEGDDCMQLGIVASGQLALQKYSCNGDFVTIGLLSPGDCYGEDLIFGTNHVFPNSIEAVTNAKIITLSKDILLSLLPENPHIVQNFMRFLSDKVQAQNRRISILSQRNLRQKISSYLLDLLQEQGDAEDQPRALSRPNHKLLTPSVEIPSSKEVAARLLAMPRPSFSRELVRMEKDGLIKINGRVIWLTNLEGLECGCDLEDYDDELDSEDGIE